MMRGNNNVSPFKLLSPTVPYPGLIHRSVLNVLRVHAVQNYDMFLAKIVRTRIPVNKMKNYFDDVIYLFSLWKG